MLRVVSFTNKAARLTKELDKTNFFVKLKKQCTVEVLNKSVKKMTLVGFGSIKDARSVSCRSELFTSYI